MTDRNRLDFDGLEDRIAAAEQRAANSRSCAETRRDEALGHDRRGDAEEAKECLKRATWHDETEGTHLRTAQALRNTQRARGWRVRGGIS